MIDPLVSVVLPVYNCEDYLGDAVESILRQTYTHFEFIIIDDGSKDRSAEVILGLRDQRIRVFHQANQGLAATLNRGISLARGQYIARQDQDDLSHPDRLAQQVAYMEAHPDCGLLGTWAQIMEVDILSDRFHRHPVDPGEIRYHLLFNNPFVHSSVLIRRSVVDAVGGYSTDPERQPPEDFELWSRISRVASIANLPEILLTYREIPGSMSRTGPSPFRNRLVRICTENIAAAADLPADDPDVFALAALTHGAADLVAVPPDFPRMRNLLVRAIERLVPPAMLPALSSDAVDRVHSLRAGWLLHGSPAYGVLQAQGPLRSLAKRVWRQLRRFRARR